MVGCYRPSAKEGQLAIRDMSRKYKKKYEVSESFPVQAGDSWSVTEKGKLAERWHIMSVRHSAKHSHFIAEITEYFKTGDAPRPPRNIE